MILYFSATGNSQYVANRIATATQDDVIDLFDRIRNDDHTAIHSDRAWIIVSPTYAWRLPRLVQQWISKTPLTGNNNIYYVLTCGGSIANAGKYLAKLSAKINKQYQGCCGILMPENYIAMFQTPTQQQAKEIIDNAQADIDNAIETIVNQQTFATPAVTCKERLMSGIVNSAFYSMCVKADSFYTTNSCISCGKCQHLCPCNNITMAEGKPKWGKHCTHCMACINHCPVDAIEYGKHTIDLPRYTFPTK